jgi:hypothetical protein
VTGSIAATRAIEPTTVERIPVEARIYYFLGVLAGLFPGFFGLFGPATLDEEFTWASLPPLHARFVGSFYVFAVLYTLGLLLARRRWQAGSGFWAIVIFTGAVGVLNLLNWEAFDFDETTVKVWIAVYIGFPVVGLVLAVLSWRADEGTERGAPLAPWARTWFLVQAVVYAIVGVLLLVARGAMADAWPWPVTNTVAQFYGGAFLSLAYISWHSAQRRSWAALVAVVPPFAVFSLLTIVVCLIHLELFSAGDLAAWVWFAFFGASAVASAAMLATMLRDRQYAVR